ncbi:unnamed protein product [Vicia faba]|uniref:Uncharacterized protein n=1 Tax=Vicia faba TaxID=3906 RepID=A0AAV0YCU8_VICFA|nr:unnamed protein product [Vicia faba]
MVEGSSNPHSDYDTEVVKKSLKSRRLIFNFSNQPLTSPKYGNLTFFPSTSFNFKLFLNHQKISGFIEDFGYVYPGLVKEFYVNLKISNDCIVSSLVNNKEILLTLEEFGDCLGIPYAGDCIKHKYVCGAGEFKQYNEWVF